MLKPACGVVDCGARLRGETGRSVSCCFESFMYLQGDLYMEERILRRRAYKNSWAKAKRHRLRAEKTRRHFGLEGTSFDDQQTIRYNEAIVTTNAITRQ